jgi:hypothetical protein
LSTQQLLVQGPHVLGINTTGEDADLLGLGSEAVYETTLNLVADGDQASRCRDNVPLQTSIESVPAGFDQGVAAVKGDHQGATLQQSRDQRAVKSVMTMNHVKAPSHDFPGRFDGEPAISSRRPVVLADDLDFD